MDVTPKAKQLLDRLNGEIDDRREKLHSASTTQAKDNLSLIASDSTLIPPEHVAFFARLFRHSDLAVLRKNANKSIGDEVGKLLGGLREPLEMLVGAAITAHETAGEAVRRLPYTRSAWKQETFAKLLAVKEYIEKNYASALPLERLAEIACLSRYHFLRLFKQVFSFTPHQYQLQCRLKRACELLCGTDLPASEVAYEVGFESHTSFAALFKRIYGVTPMAYRFRPDADSQF